MKNLPNVISVIRIIGTIALMFIEALTAWFYAVYIFCGISDVVDGWIARKTKNTSELGSRLDSAEDLLLYSVMLVKVFPKLWEVLPAGIWITVAVLVLLRLISYSLAAVKFKRFASLHTYMNKATGAAAFAIPFFLLLPYTVELCIMGCIIAGIATVEELLRHICAKEYNENRKTILLVK